MPRQYYAPTYDYRAGIQSAYDAGLSYFPDVGTGLIPSPLGFDLTSVVDVVGGVIGGVAGGPGGAAIGSQAGSIFGTSGGTAVDQARQARVNYFANLASQGNVAAMQLILGAPPNVSGNEQGMWTNAANALRQAAPDVYNAAVQLGPAWLNNSGDTATNYPAMRQFVQSWASQHPFTAAVGGVSGAIGNIFTPTPPAPGTASSVPYYATRPVATTAAPVSSGIPPVLLYGALAAGAYFLLRRR